MKDYNGFKVEVSLGVVCDEQIASLLVEFENRLEDMVREEFKGRLVSFGGKGEYLHIKEKDKSRYL